MYCGESLNSKFLIQYLKAISNTKISLNILRVLLSLKNATIVSRFLQTKKMQVSSSEKFLKPQKVDPYIRPEFHDCLDRPKIIDNFSYREIKSIERHMERLNSSHKV